MILSAILWKALLRKTTYWAIGIALCGGFIWWFNLRGETIKRLEASHKVIQAQILSERAEHAKTIEAYQAGIAAVSGLQSKRVEVVTRLQKVESEVARAPVTRGCADSPAVRVALGELREQAKTP